MHELYAFDMHQAHKIVPKHKHCRQGRDLLYRKLIRIEALDGAAKIMDIIKTKIKTNLHQPGLDPGTLGVLNPCDNQLHHRCLYNRIDKWKYNVLFLKKLKLQTHCKVRVLGTAIHNGTHPVRRISENIILFNTMCKMNAEVPQVLKTKVCIEKFIEKFYS